MKEYKKNLLMIAAIIAVSIFTAIPTIAVISTEPIPDELWDKTTNSDVTDAAYYTEGGARYAAFTDVGTPATVYVIHGNGTEYWHNDSVSGYSIAAGDVDDDGKNEIVVGGNKAGENGITVFEDDGTFKFFYETNSQYVKDIELGDINGDGVNDIVACNNIIASKVYVINGTDGNNITGWDFGESGESIQDIALGNLDLADGKDAAIISDSMFATLYVYNSTGIVWSNDSVRGRSVEIGNVDNDPENEVVIGDQGSSNVYVYNGSTGELKYSFYTAHTPSEIELGDLDGDGKDEIAVITGYEYDETIFAIDINAANQVNEMWRYEIDWTPDYYGEGIAIGDIDRDYKNEVIAASDTHEVYAFDGIDSNNDGIGDVVWRYGPYNNEAFDTAINDIEVGDVDGDGDMDVIAGTNDDTHVLADGDIYVSVNAPTLWVFSTQDKSVQVNGKDIFVDSDPSQITSLSCPPMPPNPPEGYNFPYGVFSINITVMEPGNYSIITFTLPENLSTNAEFWKYTHNGNGSPTLQPGWYQIPLGDNDGDNVITITLQDGGIGDSDGAANGVIVDQGGPALPPAGVPAFSSAGIIVLLGLLSIIASLSIRKKRT